MASQLFEGVSELLVATDRVGTDVANDSEKTSRERDTDWSPPEDDADGTTEESGDDTDDRGLLGGVTERNGTFHGSSASPGNIGLWSDTTN